jgi:hypothetical protein
VGAGIKTWRFVGNGNKGFIGENFKIFKIKFELSECRGVANPCHIQTQKMFVSRSNSST